MPSYRSIVISALRAYYTSIIDFENFTYSRSLLDVVTAIEPATSIIVASSLVLGPVIKKWFGREGLFSRPKGDLTTTSKNSKHNFQRMTESKLSDPSRSVQDIELGVMTTAQGPRGEIFGHAMSGDGQMEADYSDTARLAVKEGRGISVRKEFDVYQGN